MPGVPLSTELVREFVGAAHGNLPAVQALLQQEPGLLHAVMNWGGDDWESALGAAAHVGRRDIAEWLLAQGARMDIFAAAMLGELDIVQSMIEKFPAMAHARGPHGISLKQHALLGGERAQDVAAYLKSFELNEQGSERIVILVENRIEVRKGYGEAILERFRTPKNVHTFPGFIRMDVLHAENADGNEEIRVCTTWENEAAFQGWANSDSFRGAHAKRAEQANAQGQAQPHGQGHGHGGRHGEAEGAESASPIIGNKVTIYQVVASHLPAPAQAASEA